MGLRHLSCAVVVVLAGGLPVSAAESVDQAVEQIAQRFVAARSGKPETSRVAVTAFVQDDQKANQLTNLMMIALTGKMVELGGGTFRVIERAQLENALKEIELTEVDLFNAESAKEFGNFLGVDTLIVGEITPLFDRVRIDSRLIDVETIETIEQANVWVPLTPIVQKQLETPVRLRRLGGSDDGPDPRNGIWTGTGQCGETSFGVAISIVVGAEDTLTAIQTYYPLQSGGRAPRMEAGVLTMEGVTDPATDALTLAPLDWLYQPGGHGALGFSGTFDLNRDEIRATYTQENCNQLLLRKK